MTKWVNRGAMAFTALGGGLVIVDLVIFRDNDERPIWLMFFAITLLGIGIVLGLYGRQNAGRTPKT